MVPPVSGRIYADSGIFAGHVKTGDQFTYSSGDGESSWDEFTIIGTYTNDSLNGEVSLDGPRGSDPYGTVHLVRMGIATGMVPLEKRGGPDKFSLLQNYPDPFNPSTVIGYQLLTNSFVTLEVYDMLGREVKILVNERQTSGYHSVTFNAGSLPSGVYFYRLQDGTFSSTKKLLLLK